MRTVVGDPVAGPRRPARAVEITQRPRTVLHAWLEQVKRPSEALVASRCLAVEPVDERVERLVAEDALVRVRHELVEEPRVAGQKPQIEDLGRHRQVAVREAEDVLGAEHLVAHRHRRSQSG